MFEQDAPANLSPYTHKAKVRPEKRDEDLQQARQPQHQTSKTGGKKRPGALNAVPVVPRGMELVESAVKRASRVGPTKGIKNEGAKARNMVAKQLDSLTKELTVPLGRWIKGFPVPSALHPFEIALLELTLGDGRYEKTIGRVNSLRKKLLEVGKGHAARAAKAGSKYDCMLCRDEGFAEMETIYRKDMNAVDSLKNMAKDLRMLPVVEPEVPTLVLVGAPNVGKSSLVRMLSSGQPDVQNYPFTTRGIQLGHFFVDSERHVVTDTPGLLNREEDERNAMERLTIASIEHLPTCVVFVMDLTGLCGTSFKDQLAIREHLKDRFPNRPWMDVLSKGDLLPANPSGSVAPTPSISSASKLGASPLTTQEMVAPPPGSVYDIEDPSALLAAVTCAAEVTPHALKVSIVTEEGIEQLKYAVLDLLRNQVSLQQESELAM